MSSFNKLPNHQGSPVCKTESTQEKKGANELPTLRPDYDTIVQKWDKHPNFRESSYGMLLEVRAYSEE